MKCILKPIKVNLSRVDSHNHFWQLSRGDYSWLTSGLEELYQDFLPEQLAEELATSDVEQTILIQAADTAEETLFLLEIAKNTKFVAGVVGWVNMEDPLAIAQLESLAKNPYFKGIRPMLQDIDDVNWILKDEFTPIFEFMTKKRLTFDALIRPMHLPNIQLLAKRHPKLKIVINHCAKPDLSKESNELWRKQLANTAEFSNVYIKLSGLLTEADLGEVLQEVIQPYFDHVMTLFGANRVMWGSDWPVIKLNGDYDIWVEMTKNLLKNYSFKDKRKIWSLNAKHFYNLPLY